MSSINDTAHFQPLQPDLGLPTTDADSAEHDTPNIHNVEQFWAFLAASGTEGPDAVNKPRANTQAAASGRQHLNSLRATAMGPPPGPRVQVTPRSVAAYHAFSHEVNQAVARAGTATQGSTGAAGSKPKPLTTAQLAAAAAQSPEEAGQIVAQTVERTLDTMNQSTATLLREFIRLRVVNDSNGLESLQAIGELSSDLQKSQLEVQRKKSIEADKATRKANAKAEKMGIFSKLAAVVIMVISAVLAVASFGTLTGLAIVAAAMVAGFLVGGFVGGSKKGNGFDVMSGIEGAGYAADIVAVGPLIMAAAKAIVMTAIKATSKEAMIQAGKKAAQEGAEAAGEQAAKVVKTGMATEAAKGGKELALKAAQARVNDLASKGAKEAAQKLAKVERETALKAYEMAVDAAAAAAKGSKSAQKAAYKAGGKALAATMDASTTTAASNFLRGMRTTFAKEFSSTLSWVHSANIAEMNASAAGKAFDAGGEKILEGFKKAGQALSGGKARSPIQSMGDAAMLSQFVMGSTMGVIGLGQSSVQLHASMLQNQAQKRLAEAQLAKVFVTIFDNMYKTPTDAVQNFTEAHKKTVDQVLAMYNNMGQTNTIQANALLSR